MGNLAAIFIEGLVHDSELWRRGTAPAQDHRVFWMDVFVNLASVLYLGSLALETIMGVPMAWGLEGSLVCGGSACTVG